MGAKMSFFGQVLLSISVGTVSLVIPVSVPTSNQSITIVTYTSNLMNASYQLMTSITSIDQSVGFSDSTIGFNITTRSLKISSFEVRFYSVVFSKIVYTKLTYLCIDYTIRNLQFFVLQNYLGNGMPGPLPPMTTNSDFLYNFTSKINRYLILGPSQYILEPFIKGFKIINQNFQQYSMQLSAVICNQSFYQVSVESKSPSTQQVTDVYVTVLVYNQTLIDSRATLLNKYQIQFGRTNQAHSNFGSYHIRESNFFLGLKGFNFIWTTYSFHYDFFFDFPGNMVQLNGDFPPLQTLTTTIFSLQKYQCLDPVYPYFMNWTHLCYSRCPVARYYEDQPSKKCAPCQYDCYTCQDGKNCSSCNSTHFFRQNNLQADGSLRCKPLFGYYSTRSNDVVAQRCAVSCVQCSLTAANCTKCLSNQYLDLVSYVGTCTSCMNLCVTCDNGQTCKSCINLYALDAQSLCVPICGQNCDICHIQTIPIQASVCDTCEFGYHINQSQTSSCYSICGDGMWVEGVENCDDNNTQNGDGCSFDCKQELGYKCYSVSNTLSIPQSCFYEQQVRFSLKKLQKYLNKNAFRFDLSLSTLNPSVLKQLDWSKIIIIDIEYLSFQLISKTQTYTDFYQSSISTLVLTFQVDYTTNVKTSIEVQIDPKRNNMSPTVNQVKSSLVQPTTQYKSVSTLIINSTKFDTTPSTKQTVQLKSQNGMAVIYQSDSIFTIAQLLEYCLFGIAAITLLMLPFSFSIYGGKIIALQYLFVVSCAYFSLVGFDNLQVYSTVQALSGLKLITLNFNSISYQQNSSLWWAGINSTFTNNCFGLMLILILPFTYCIIMKILTKYIQNPQYIKQLESIKTHLGYGQVFMTFYLIGAYAFTVNLLLSVLSITKSATPDIIGVSFGIIISIGGILLFVVLIKKKTYFWQYLEHFYKNSVHQYYINFTLITIWINSIILVVLKNIPYGNAVPILLSLLWILFLVRYKPFKKQIQRKRPIIIQAFNIIVQIIFLVIKIQLTNNDQLNQISTFFLYLPFFILILLALGLAYTIYCLVIKIKAAIIDRKEFLQNQNLFQKVNNNSKDISPNSQKSNQIPIDKEIMENFRKQKGFNFISRSLSYDKKELEEKWNDFQKIQNTSYQTGKMKQIKKQIRKSAFLQNNNLMQYFKIKLDAEDKNLSSETEIKSQHNSQSPKDSIKPQNIQCLNCGQNLEASQKKGKIITVMYETEKYKEEWKSFFKPKELDDQQKKHSMAIYDMI